MEFEYEYQRALSVMEEVKKAVTGKDQCIERLLRQYLQEDTFLLRMCQVWERQQLPWPFPRL